MRAPLLVVVLALAACSPTPPAAVPSPFPSPTGTPRPAPTPTAASTPTRSPAPIDGVATNALGTLRGEIAWVLRAVTATSTNRTTAEIWAVPLAGGEPRLAASYRVGPFSRFGPVTGIVLDRQITRLGTKLALETPDYDRPRPGVIVVDLPTGAMQEIAGTAAGLSRWITPAWSPDMTRLAFVAVGDISGGALMTMPADGSAQTEEVAARIPERTVLYEWVDDTRVAYGRAFERATYEVVTTGSRATARFPDEAGSWNPPAPGDWRRDAPRFVAAATEGQGGEARLAVADDVGAPLRIIAREPARSDRGVTASPVFAAARWSPRGEVLYQRSFVPDTSGPFEHDCFVVAASGGTPTKLPLRGKAHRCEWLPSGDRVAYLHGDTGIGLYATALRVAMRDGSAEREYTLPPAAGAGDVRLLDVAIRVYP